MIFHETNVETFSPTDTLDLLNDVCADCSMEKKNVCSQTLWVCNTKIATNFLVCNLKKM